MICPICKGSGQLHEPNIRKNIDRTHIIHILRKEGYSIRQIASLVNLRSPNSVAYILKKGDSDLDRGGEHALAEDPSHHPDLEDKEDGSNALHL